jgi:hypothetical protein
MYENPYKQGTVELDIHRKLTTTDIAISNAPCHCDEHKMATFKNWIHRLNQLPTRQSIMNVARNNGYNKQQVIELYNLEKQKRHKDTLNINKYG